MYPVFWLLSHQCFLYLCDQLHKNQLQLLKDMIVALTECFDYAYIYCGQFQIHVVLLLRFAIDR